MNNMKKVLYIFTVALLAGSCFKNEPQREMMRAAGAWNIEKVTLTDYDQSGSVVSTKEATDLGVLMLNHNDDFLYEGTFSLSYNQSYVDWSSEMTQYFLAANIWFVTVEAKRFGLGIKDNSTGYVQASAAFTIDKLSNRKMTLHNVVNDSDGNIQRFETWYLKRP